jgi:outer membrane lipoprotein carrier protein
MHHRSKSIAVLLSLYACLGVASGPDDESLADQLSRRLATVRTMDATFTQTTTDRDGRTTQAVPGHLWIESPNRFRVESEPPLAQVLVSDGSTLWTYDLDLEQVIIGPMDADIQQVPILLLGGETGKILAAYEVSEYADETSQHYVMRPLSAGSLFETLAIEFTGETLIAITLVDGLGQRTRIQFAAMTVNGLIDPARFLFAIPAGVDVIDDRVP